MIDALSKDDWSAVIEQQTEQTLSNGAATANEPQASQWVSYGGLLSRAHCEIWPVTAAWVCNALHELAKTEALNRSATALKDAVLDQVLDGPLHWCFVEQGGLPYLHAEPGSGAGAGLPLICF